LWYFKFVKPSFKIWYFKVPNSKIMILRILRICHFNLVPLAMGALSQVWTMVNSRESTYLSLLWKIQISKTLDWIKATCVSNENPIKTNVGYEKVWLGQIYIQPHNGRSVTHHNTILVQMYLISKHLDPC